MDARSLSRYRAALIAMRDEIRRAGAVRVDPVRRDPVAVGGDEDEQPLAEMLQVIASKRNASRAGELARIEAAIARIDEAPEDYGLCAECEEEIAPGRLAAMPWVERCIDCQGKRDAPRGGTRRHLTDFD
ncbi:MAG TPA: TraR/DksA family transcriptional regulator [Vulgatibacter sp.]|nr:TraR/DksA family transcriptional regulator [Vulgatibacter sp.]